MFVFLSFKADRKFRQAFTQIKNGAIVELNKLGYFVQGGN